MLSLESRLETIYVQPTYYNLLTELNFLRDPHTLGP